MSLRGRKRLRAWICGASDNRLFRVFFDYLEGSVFLDDALDVGCDMPLYHDEPCGVLPHVLVQVARDGELGVARVAATFADDVEAAGVVTDFVEQVGDPLVQLAKQNLIRRDPRFSVRYHSDSSLAGRVARSSATSPATPIFSTTEYLVPARNMRPRSGPENPDLPHRGRRTDQRRKHSGGRLTAHSGRTAAAARVVGQRPTSKLRRTRQSVRDALD